MPAKGTTTKPVLNRRRKVKRLWSEGFTIAEQADMLSTNKHVIWSDWMALGLNGKRRPEHSRFMKTNRRQR